MFEPRRTRFGTSYPDLKDHDFSEDEKRAFLALAEAEERIHGLSFKALCERYKIPRSTARDWKDRVSFDLPVYSGPGRPSRWSEEDKKGIRSDLIAARNDHHTANKRELRKILQARADHTSDINHAEPERISTSSIRRIKDELNIVPRKVQVISHARQHSGSDFRMLYSMVLLATATMKNTPPQLNWNYDFTQYQITTRGESDTGYIIGDDENKEPVSVVRDSALPFAIKYAHMSSAAGESAPLVFMVAISELKHEEWLVVEVAGLVTPTCKSRKGYLYFGKDRSGTSEFWRWFEEKIVLATITDCRADYDLRDGNQMYTEATATCDGEMHVMKEIFTNELMTQFTDQEVTIGKLPASCSGILQASDRAKTFMASKKRLHTVVEDDLVVSNPVVEDNLNKAFKQLEDKYEINVPSGKKNGLIYGCQAVMRALSDTIKPKVIEDGFRVTGQYPLNISVMLDQSYADIDEDMRQTMNTRLERDLRLFREQGYLTEEQYEASGIPTNDDQTGMLRDQKGMHNQRAMLLTHPATVERRQLKLSNGVDLGDIMTAQDLSKDEAKVLADATKLVARENNKQSRKRREQERREGQTEEQRKAESQNQKQKTENNRRQREDDIAQAHAVLDRAKRGRTTL